MGKSVKAGNESTYLAYGTSVSAAADFTKHLFPAQHNPEAHVALREGLGEQHGLLKVANFPTSHGRELLLFSDDPLTAASAQNWRFEVTNVLSFGWQSGQREIRFEWVVEESPALLSFWFIHIVLPLYLSIESDYDFLHAGAVEVDNSAVLFIAPTTGGKSTLTGFFVDQGHRLLSDDKLATRASDRHFLAVPSHPNYRPYRQAEDLGYRAESFGAKPLPVVAIFSLQRVGSGDAVQISEITGFRKFDRLLPNSILGLPCRRERRMRYLADLVNTVPVCELQVPHALDRLDEVHSEVCRHADRLAAGNSA